MPKYLADRCLFSIWVSVQMFFVRHGLNTGQELPLGSANSTFLRKIVSISEEVTKKVILICSAVLFFALKCASIFAK